jgi:hypothetical protein
VPDSAPAERAVLATSLVVLAGLAVRLAGGAATTGVSSTALGPAASGTGRDGRICFEVVGASARPGLRCVRRPGTAEVAARAPCDDAASLRELDRLLRVCPLHGRRLVLAPQREGGPCRPRLAELHGAVRLLLGLPIDLRTARREDLEALPGVGPRLADELLRARATRPGPVDLEGLAGLGEQGRRRLERRLVWSVEPDPECRGAVRPLHTCPRRATSPCIGGARCAIGCGFR